MKSKSEVKRVAAQNPGVVADEYVKLKEENERLRAALKEAAKFLMLAATAQKDSLPIDWTEIVGASCRASEALNA